MEKFSRESSDTFVREEQKKYTDALDTLLNKITNAYNTFAPSLNEIEAEANISNDYIQKLLQYPIEEIIVIMDKLAIDATNISLALALRNALIEKIDNLRE